ncbi:6827_t:CDS:1, partial [Ambispora leptoticha]
DCIAKFKLALNSLTNFSRPEISNSINIENHVSWNFAENVQIPYSSQQEGVTYFKSLYKVEVFGVCEEAMPRQ